MLHKSLLFFVSGLLFTACKDKDQLFKDAICIQNITTIDAEAGAQENQTVVLQDEKIIKVAPTDELQLALENNIIDGTGKFMIPGLWDAHVHFAYIEELAPAMFNLFLAYGITSVRDTGGKTDFVKKWKDQADANPTEAPRVFFAGPLMDGMPNVYNGSTPARPPLSVGLKDVEAAEQMADELIAQGVDLLKAYEMLSPEQFKAIMKKAKEKDIIVTGHIPLSMDAITVADLGMNSIEHLRNLEMSMAKDSEELLKMRQKLLELGKEEEGGVLRANIHQAQRMEAIANADKEKTKAVLAALKRNNTWQVPTLSIMTAVVDHPFANPEWKKSFDYLPESVGKKWTESLDRYLEREVPENQKVYAQWLYDMTKQMQEEKIGILAGTDCPIFYLLPGLSLHGELEFFSRAGMSPMEILKSATLSPAQYFDMEDELGLIQEGMFADLLLLDANPLEDIRNTQQINTVIRHGKVYDREALKELLEEASN
ncbi:MAG: amidohydrolase family protein [Bacteroidota bacterium]